MPAMNTIFSIFGKQTSSRLSHYESVGSIGGGGSVGGPHSDHQEQFSDAHDTEDDEPEHTDQEVGEEAPSQKNMCLVTAYVRYAGVTTAWDLSVAKHG